jgi:hypothetical protein
MDRGSIARRSKLLGIDSRGDAFYVSPQFLTARNLYDWLRRFAFVYAACLFRTIDRDSDNVVPNRELVAVAKPLRGRHPMHGTVQERAVGGNVIQPVTSILITDFTMFAGDVPSGIGQCPIEMCSTADIDAAFAVDANADRATIRQGSLIDQLKSQGHCAIFRTLNTTVSAAARAAHFAAAGRFHRGFKCCRPCLPVGRLVGEPTKRQGPGSAAPNHNAPKMACFGCSCLPRRPFRVALYREQGRPPAQTR